MKAILKQTSWLVLTQLLTRIIGFFYTIFLAQNLGVSDFGLFSVALAYFSLLSAFADFGFNRFLIREIARDHLSSSQLLFNTTLLRSGLTIILLIIFAVFLYFFDPDKVRVSITILAILALIPQAIALTFDAVLVALRKLKFSAIALVVLSIATTTLGVLLIINGLGPQGAVMALLSGQLMYLLTLFLILTYQGTGITGSFDGSFLKKIMIGSLPYGLLGVLGMIYFRIDTVMLSYLRGNFETGIYGTAYKFFEAVVFIPSALATALFPVFARLYDIDTGEIKRIYFKSLKIMLALAAVVILGYLTILPFIIRQLLPNFIQSIEAIKILALAIPFMFIHFPGVQVILATDKFLKPVLMLSLFALSFNIVTNLIFIPRFGFIAASWTTVASEILSFILFFQLLRVKVFKN